MKIVNEYERNERNKFPIMSMNDIIREVSVNAPADFEKLIVTQSVVSYSGLHIGTGSYSVRKDDSSFDNAMKYILEKDLIPRITEVESKDTYTGIKVISPENNGPSNHAITITEEYFLNTAGSRAWNKFHITSSFYSKELRDYMYEFMSSHIESKYGGRNELMIRGEFIEHSNDGSKLVPMKWLCHFEHGNLLCDYQIGRDEILHPIDDYISENGLMDIFDRGLTIEI